jgi:hypothetical protein
MKVLVIHQPFPMGNYRLMPYIGHHLKEAGHEVQLMMQLNGNPFHEEYVDAVANQNFDVIYYEMLDRSTFKLISRLNNSKRILCYASKGVLETFEQILEYKGEFYDSIITNSKVMFDIFQNSNIESKFFEYYPAPLFESEIKTLDSYKHKHVYLGGGFQRLTEPNYQLERDLIYNNKEVAKYGKGWQNVPNYRGVLPPDKIGNLYASADFSIGTIEPSQRVMGMVNNRYSEMFKAGNSILSLDYPGVDYYGGEEFLSFISSLEDFSKVQPIDEKHKKRQKEFILAKEVDFFNSLKSLI